MDKFVLTALLVNFLFTATAQESLLKGVEDSLPLREKVSAAFKSTRVINAHSTEMLGRQNLDFRILHRFGPLNTGVKGWFGLDGAAMRMAFDYGITNNLMVGIGRSTLYKEVDGFVKTRIFQQATGPRSIPFSLLVAAGASVWTAPSSSLPRNPAKLDASQRTSYYIQLIAGRKFSNKISLQLSPIVLHQNWVAFPEEKNTLFAIGGGARYKFSKRMAVTMDYHHAIRGISNANYDPLSIGIDIETGGHVFQLHFSNAQGMNERAYLTQTNSRDMRFGFNLSRVFKLGKKRS